LIILASRPGAKLYETLLREIPRERLDKCSDSCEKLRRFDFGDTGVRALKDFLLAVYDAAMTYDEIKRFQLPALGPLEREEISDRRGISDQHAQLIALGEEVEVETLRDTLTAVIDDNPRQALLDCEMQPMRC